MKTISFILLFTLTLNVFAAERMRFPRSPDLSITPGALCSTPNEFRYKERIAYCTRDVSGWQKELVFISYRKLGYSLSGERSEYKVDHFIPLCVGGSNEMSNLWPQYFTVSEKTDIMEQLACDVLVKGKISQREVIELIMTAKLDLEQLPEIIKHLRRLNRQL